MNTNKWMLTGGMMTVVFLTGCIVPSDSYQTRSVRVVPPLPALVVLETEPYYVCQGFHYYYRDNRWFYAQSRGGPWVTLPRDCYPRETRYRHSGLVYGHEARPEIQVFIAPPLPPIVVFDTEPYYVYQGCHYHYRDNGWYYSHSKDGPWTTLPRDRYPKEIRHTDGRRWDDHGHGTQIRPTITHDRHQEIKKPEHTFGSDRNRLDSASGSQRKPLVPTVERHERVVTPIPLHQERVQPSLEYKAPMPPSTRHPEPPKERNPTVTPSIRHQEALQSPKELKPAVTQPVVQRETVVIPARESRSLQPERGQRVKSPFAGRSEKTGISPQVPPSQPVAESNDKTGKEQNKNKEHSH